MIRSRGLYSSEPPPYRTIFADNPTLLITWWATGCSIFIILARCFGRYVRTMRLFRDDWWMLCSIIPLVIRLALANYVLKHGTNNVQTAFLTQNEITKRERGSGVVLAARVFFAIYIWSQKLCITEFYKRLTTQFWRGSYDKGLVYVRYTLLFTLIGVIISTFTECRPFSHYWQVVPDPGPQCREGMVQLLTMGALDAATDIMLVIFPIPAIIYSKLTRKRKSQLISLFSLSLVVVCVTISRIPATIERGNAQPFRTLMASLEILAATFASNALVLNSFLRDKGPKRPKFKGHGDSEISRIASSKHRRNAEAGAAFWGSDEDLVRDVGFGVELEMTATSMDGSSNKTKINPYNNNNDGNHKNNPNNDYISQYPYTTQRPSDTFAATRSGYASPASSSGENRRIAARLSTGSSASGLIGSAQTQSYDVDGITECDEVENKRASIIHEEVVAAPAHAL